MPLPPLRYLALRSPLLGATLACLLAAPARAQTGITVSESSASHQFGQNITFTLTAASDNAINSVSLLWQVAGESRTHVEAPTFAPARQVAATYTADVAAQPIMPFRAITYWWQIGDAANQNLTTDRQILFYDDNRFTWHSTTSAGVTAHWVAGDLAFGQAAVDVGVAALPRANRIIGAPLSASLDIYIYPSLKDFQTAATLTGRQWVGGHAEPALGVVLLAIPAGPEASLQLQRDLPHELTHVLVYERTGAYASVPSWLDEGLAVTNQAVPDSVYHLALQEAVRAKALIPVVDLCGTFPAAPAQATLAYAESESLVRYVQDRWGSAKLSSLLDAYADGASCEGGVQRALGVSLAGLQSAWQSEVLQADPLATAARAILPWLAVAVLPALGLAFFALAPRRKV